MIQVRDDAIDITCSNLIMAGCLLPEERGLYMLRLMKQSDAMLGLSLADSIRIRAKALELSAWMRKDSRVPGDWWEL